MCGCSEHGRHDAGSAVAPGLLTLKIDDMTCGHCASTISRAIEGAFPNAEVTADAATGLVEITGVTDLARVARVVREAGYTPALE